ncbi:MAG: hypothetical protein ACM3SQ_12335 [Betaproteobacteria bacterium]
MRNAPFVAVLCVAASLAPRPAFAWGAAAHRFIMAKAITILPPGIKPFFDRHRDEIVLRVNDPDLWRDVPWDDDAYHFVNFGAPELGPFPFVAFPRELGAALEKFGAVELRHLGMLPWREQEESGNLRRAFEGFARQTPYAESDAVLFSAVASHYIQDAYQPFHASNNYDGQLTNQFGIHSRFETALFERFGSQLTITPAPPVPMTDARGAAFTALLESHQLVQRVLDADKAAVAGRTVYDDSYFEQFFAKVKPILEEQLSQAVSATAGLIVGAWDAAGKPALRTERRPPQKVRSPG